MRVSLTGVGHMGSSKKFSATGGTITFSGGNTIHTFTASGTFTVTGIGNVNWLVVAGGGGAAANGGGAGGVRTSDSEGQLAVSTQAYTITVGDGGVGSAGGSLPGADSTFSSITSTGGGGDTPGNRNGGSGTGNRNGGAAGTGIAGQGHDGGTNGSTASSGGGGGGGGNASGCTPGTGGLGGGANGNNTGSTADAGVANTGGGGGGNNTGGSGAGGSGIVIISYPT